MTVKVVSSIKDISSGDWDPLVEKAPPFFQYQWLLNLEEAGLLSEGNGWKPSYFCGYQDNKLISCLPMYEKNHSMGEFVFDFAWADVSAQLGLPYYPKLVGTQPFTPSPGFQILSSEPLDSTRREALFTAVKDFARDRKLASVNLLWWADQPPPAEFIEWKHQVFLWRNQQFATFEDYLKCFTKNQRRNIKREIRDVQQAGITIEILTQEDLTPQLMDFIWECYYRTNDKFGPWGALFLNRQFFQDLLERDLKGLRIFLARKSGRNLAMSFLIEGQNTIYGRYWGTLEYHKSLHFVLCYYQPIKYCIQQGISSFDPGMGSAHKVRRGFESFTSSSFHFFRDPLMGDIFQKYIPQVNRETQTQILQLNEAVPWSHS